MEVRIEKTRLDDWFNDRTDYFNSDLSEISFSGVRTFAYTNRPIGVGSDRPSYIIVPENDSIRKGTITLPLDILARLQGIDLVGAQHLLFKFRKTNFRLILPEEYDQHYEKNNSFRDRIDFLRDNRSELIAIVGEESAYMKGSLALARSYGIRIIS